MGFEAVQAVAVFAVVLWGYLAAAGHQARLAGPLRPWWGWWLRKSELRGVRQRGIRGG